MHHSPRVFEKPSNGGTSPHRAGPEVFRGARNELGEEASAFIKLDCCQCRRPFVLDGEEWDRPPREMETLGREFLGVPKDAVLCTTCLHGVELAGAQRLYWQAVS